MKSPNYISTFLLGVSIASLIGQTATANAVDTLAQGDNTFSDVSDFTAVKCSTPAARDYHEILSAYNGETSEDYKFSGCGTAL